MENNIIHLRYGAYQHLNLLNLKRSKKLYNKNQLSFFDQWHDLTEKSQFNALHKIIGLVIATFRSAFKLLKQIVKKIWNLC
jgi:hypothetical protein